MERYKRKFKEETKSSVAFVNSLPEFDNYYQISRYTVYEATYDLSRDKIVSKYKRERTVSPATPYKTGNIKKSIEHLINNLFLHEGNFGKLDILLENGYVYVVLYKLSYGSVVTLDLLNNDDNIKQLLVCFEVQEITSIKHI